LSARIAQAAQVRAPGCRSDRTSTAPVREGGGWGARCGTVSPRIEVMLVCSGCGAMPGDRQVRAVSTNGDLCTRRSPVGANDHPRAGAVVTKGWQAAVCDQSPHTRRSRQRERDRSVARSLISRMVAHGGRGDVRSCARALDTARTCRSANTARHGEQASTSRTRGRAKRPTHRNRPLPNRRR
jgi:hypothetical protein